MAETIEQQHVHYRHSPIVNGSGSSLQLGDFLYVPETHMAAALARCQGHLAIVLPADGAHATLPDDFTAPPIAARDVTVLTEATGLSQGGVVIVRPDGYVGFIGTDPASGIDAYLRGLL